MATHYCFPCSRNVILQKRSHKWDGCLLLPNAPWEVTRNISLKELSRISCDLLFPRKPQNYFFFFFGGRDVLSTLLPSPGESWTYTPALTPNLSSLRASAQQRCLFPGILYACTFSSTCPLNALHPQSSHLFQVPRASML